jgi:hypothetical protein
MVLITILSILATPLAARTYTVTPRLYRVVYADEADINEKELVRELSAMNVTTPYSPASFGPLVASVINRIEEYSAVTRAEFTCDLNALVSDRCAARRVVIYSMMDGAKGARSSSNTSLVPLDQWDITKRYGVLPLRAGYSCEVTQLRYDGKWRLDPAEVRCKSVRSNEWIVEVVVKPPPTLLPEEQNGLIIRLSKALYDALDAVVDERLVSYRAEKARQEKKIATLPIYVQMSFATRVDYELELIVREAMGNENPR